MVITTITIKRKIISIIIITFDDKNNTENDNNNEIIVTIMVTTIRRFPAHDELGACRAGLSKEACLVQAYS